MTVDKLPSLLLADEGFPHRIPQQMANLFLFVALYTLTILQTSLSVLFFLAFLTLSIHFRILHTGKHEKEGHHERPNFTRVIGYALVFGDEAKLINEVEEENGAGEDPPGLGQPIHEVPVVVGAPVARPPIFLLDPNEHLGTALLVNGESPIQF